jgi:hypothetical protein
MFTDSHRPFLVANIVPTPSAALHTAPKIAYPFTTRSLQNLTFAMPEAAQIAVEKLSLDKPFTHDGAPRVACRPLWLSRLWRRLVGWVSAA